jgi:hypothetical protein
MATKKVRAKAQNGDARVEPTISLVQLTKPAPAQEEIALKAYLLWEERGRPFGSAEEDWFRAKEQLSA